MNFSHSSIVIKLRNILFGTPFYHPTRFLYNKIALFNAKRTVQLGNLNVTFWTPTFKILEDLEIFAEKELLLSFLKSIRPGDIVWDVGANTGLYSLFPARIVNATGWVIAFEPEPKTRRLLERNIALNKINNITVLSYALDRETGMKTLYPSATPNPGSHSFVQRTDYKVKRKGIQVNAITGETLIRDKHVPAPNVLKIDVEGAEMNVLQGMASVLQLPTLRMLLVEVHPKVLPLFGARADSVENLIRTHRFSRINRIERGTEFHLLCQRT